MPPVLLIIADDLTGANDTGVQFARQGISTIVSIHHEIHLTIFAEDCQVLVVNTESRHVAPDEAYARVYKVAQQGVARGIPHFYKKTDSTLRGNIGSELAALLAATNEQALFFAPAYPKLHRTTERGSQLVADVPLGQTSFADDLLNPVNEAFVPTILARQTDVQIRLFAGEVVENSTPTIYVMNAASDDDLRCHARWLQEKKLIKLLAGSAGWAEFLPEVFPFKSSPSFTTSLNAPMLIVNGSLHENSLRQITCAAQHGIPMIDFVMGDCVKEVCDKINATGHAILTTNAKFSCAQAAANLAQKVNQILAQSPIKTLIVFGGDTLMAIANELDWKAFCPRAEIMPGVPIVEICEDKNLLLVTKAGGFGEEDLLITLKLLID